MKLLRRVKRLAYRLINPVLPLHAPDFLIIGAQKAGTTTLHHWLAQHPGISASQTKELHYFDERLSYGMTLSAYEAHFKKMRLGKTMFFESTPEYLYHPDCATRIAQAYPEIRLIAVLREPVSRAWSAWTMYDRLARNGIITRTGLRGTPPQSGNRLFELLLDETGLMRPFADCLRIEQEMIAHDGAGAAHEPGLLRRGLYLDQLARYEAHFPRDRLLVLGFGELKSNPEAMLERIHTFLGLPVKGAKVSKGGSRNVNRYVHQPDPETMRELEEFYAEPNAALFDRYGPIEW